MLKSTLTSLLNTIKYLAEAFRIHLLGVIALIIIGFAVLNAQYLIIHFHYWLTRTVPVDTEAPSNPIATPNIVTVPSLNIDAPIQYVDIIDEAVFQAALKDGVVHYPGTALPGQPGNCYIFGHSSDYIWSGGHYKTVFALLPNIKIGDDIFITDQSGTLFIYRVVETKVVKPDDLSVLDQYENKKKLLTLQTSYPVGTALRRFVAIAEIKP